MWNRLHSFRLFHISSHTHTHTRSSVSQSEAFCLRVSLQKPPHSFQVNMKLEAVDVRNPVMVRVATVVDRDEHRVKVRTYVHGDDLSPPAYVLSSAHFTSEGSNKVFQDRKLENPNSTNQTRGNNT